MRRSPIQLKPTPEQRAANSTLARKPLARAVQVQLRKPINAVSEKRKAANAVRRRVLAEMRQADPLCARCRVAPWTDGNELLRRSAGGSITDRNNIVGLCRPCHEHIGAHPAEAIRDGWQISRFA